MTYGVYPAGGIGSQFFDDEGDPLAGGEVWTYLAGTTTPIDTWSDIEGVAKRTNPIILDSAGRIPDSSMVYLVQGKSYDFVVIRKNITYVTIQGVRVGGGTPTPSPPPTDADKADVTMTSRSTVQQGGGLVPYAWGPAIAPAYSDFIFVIDPVQSGTPPFFYYNVVVDASTSEDFELDLFAISVSNPTTGASTEQAEIFLERSDTKFFTTFTTVFSGITRGEPYRMTLTAGYYRLRYRYTPYTLLSSIIAYLSATRP